MTAMNTRSKASPLVDNSGNYEPPLDFTFKCLTTFLDCLEEDPRTTKETKKDNDRSSPLSPKLSKTAVKRRTNAIRLSNNVLTDWNDFSETIEKLISNPDGIEWIDLSFNDMVTIDKCILQYRNLKVLYLHGNAIEKINEVDKLVNLPHLKSLTIHGNPIEEQKGYRQYVLSRIPQLKNFDFSGVTKSDRACSGTWSQMNKRQKSKSKKT